MSYTPTEWKSGDTITSAKLNKMEQGIAAGGSGGGVLVVVANMGTGALDKTWQEINDADYAVLKITPQEGHTNIFLPYMVWNSERGYGVSFSGIGNNAELVFEAIATSASGYPIVQEDG